MFVLDCGVSIWVDSDVDDGQTKEEIARIIKEVLRDGLEDIDCVDVYDVKISKE